MSYFYVFIGGGLGSMCRYIITQATVAKFGVFLPVSTLFVNTCGSFFMSFVMGLLLPIAHHLHLLPESARLMLTVGFLGGLSTFSALTLETVTLFRGGHVLLSILNMGANVFSGLTAAVLGMYLAAWWHE
ncbi:MAG: CrcB family protein [Selenomonadaceae bacterium]|nr:CrcB family protein [Selenomonadaceae bacterium]